MRVFWHVIVIWNIIAIFVPNQLNNKIMANSQSNRSTLSALAALAGKIAE